YGLSSLRRLRRCTTPSRVATSEEPVHAACPWKLNTWTLACRSRADTRPPTAHADPSPRVAHGQLAPGMSAPHRYLRSDLLPAPLLQSPRASVRPPGAIGAGTTPRAASPHEQKLS